MSPEPRTAVRSDADGRFVLDGVCDTAIWLAAGGQGFTRQEHGPLAAGDSFDVEVAPAPVVRVTVVDGEGKPVADASVMVTTSALPDLLGRQGGTTDTQGRFEFTWLATPTAVSVNDHDYRPLAFSTLTAVSPCPRRTARDGWWRVMAACSSRPRTSAARRRRV